MDNNGANPQVEILLSQANLQRLRGDYEQAEATCKVVLKSFPGNPDALSLLGDIKVESGDLADAIHWYGLAIHEAPDRPGLSEKLARAIESHQLAEEDAGAAQIGLPEKKWPAWAIPAIISVAAVILLAAAFYAGSKSSPPSVYKEPISLPVAPTGPAQDQPGTTDSGQTENPKPEPSASVTRSDIPVAYRAIPRIKAAIDDPRTKSAHFAIQSDAQTAPAEEALRIAGEVLQKFDLNRVTIQLLGSDLKPIYIADFPKAEPLAAADEWAAPGAPTSASQQPDPATNLKSEDKPAETGSSSTGH